jgi:pimeloyl-ACP methyl ester carboxylesterase
LKTILTTAGVIGLVYLFLVAFYALMQRSMIFYPATVSLEQARQQAEALGGAPWLSKDGHWQGWTFPSTAAASEGQRPRAVVFHGNAGMALNRGYYVDLLLGFSASGPWTVYIHEYPGYGPREGTPSQAEFTAAALQALDQLLAQNPEPVLLIGESLGSGVASELARLRPDAVAALLLITPFDSMVNLARHHMPFLPAGLLLRDRFDNLDALRNFHKPLVVVTAGQDTIVPAALAEPLLRQHTGPSLHKVQAAAGHNTLHFNPRRSPWPEVDGFLATELRQQWGQSKGTE